MNPSRASTRSRYSTFRKSSAFSRNAASASSSRTITCGKRWGFATTPTSSTTDWCSPSANRTRSFIMKTLDAFISARISGCRGNAANHPPFPNLARLNYDPPGEVLASHSDETDSTAQALAAPDADAAAAAIDTPAAALDHGTESGAREISRGKSAARARRCRWRDSGSPCAHERRSGERPSGARGGGEHGESVADGHLRG